MDSLANCSCMQDTQAVSQMLQLLQSKSTLLGTWGAYFVLIFFVFMLFLLWPSLRRLIEKLSRGWLFILAFVVWLLGVFIYTLGFYHPNLEFTSIVPRAIISSFRMFLMQNELARVDDLMRKDAVYMNTFSLTHFVAVLLSVLFIMKLIGFRMKSALDLWWFSIRGASRKGGIVNIFWGMNEASFLLAESISSNEESGKNGHIVFVNLRDVSDDCPDKKIGLSSILDVMHLNNAEISRLERLDAYVSNCHADITKVEQNPKGKVSKSLLRTMKQKRLEKIIAKAEKVNWFFLSDDENYNLNATLKVMKDKALSSKNQLTVYVHAFNGKMNDIYNHYSLFKSRDEAFKAKLKIVDSSYLSVATLKRDKKLNAQPINFVSIDEKTATVKSPLFSSLVVGFGETGQEAFNFLYEFASFIDAQGNKVPFRCTAIDKSIHQISAFFAGQEGILENELNLIQAEIDSKAYWETINPLLPTLNYVVVSINDDDLAMNTAINIYNAVAKVRANQLNNFAIYVRCNSRANYAKMQDIEDVVNQNNKLSGAVFKVFGNPQSIYTYDMVVADKILTEAKAFHLKYSLTYEKKECYKFFEEVKKNIKDSEKYNFDDTWMANVLWKHNFESKIREQGQVCTEWILAQDVIRKMNQNISNSLHKQTKWRLLGVNKENVELLQESIDERGDGSLIYPKADASLQIKLINVAKCEHLRWESSHKLLGWKYAPERSVLRKEHEDMVPWSKLDVNKQSYDCNVVDTTIWMYYKEMENN